MMKVGTERKRPPKYHYPTAATNNGSRIIDSVPVRGTVLDLESGGLLSRFYRIIRRLFLSVP